MIYSHKSNQNSTFFRHPFQLCFRYSTRYFLSEHAAGSWTPLSKTKLVTMGKNWMIHRIAILERSTDRMNNCFCPDSKNHCSIAGALNKNTVPAMSRPRHVVRKRHQNEWLLMSSNTYFKERSSIYDNEKKTWPHIYWYLIFCSKILLTNLGLFYFFSYYIFQYIFLLIFNRLIFIIITKYSTIN